MKNLPTILSIAGSDCSAGAGIQADLKTIHALGGYALTVPTALTSQNSLGVQQVFPVNSRHVRQQLYALSEDYQIDTIKIGMLTNKDIIEEVSNWLTQFPSIPAILDPIIISSSGKPLLDSASLTSLKTELFPLITLVTPNLPELNALLNSNFLGLFEETDNISHQLTNQGWPNTLLKGGHSKGADAQTNSIDYLFGKQPLSCNESHVILQKSYSSPRLSVQHNHGTGCTLSSAIATYLAKGQPIAEAIQSAKSYLFEALKNADKGQPRYVVLNEDENRQRHGGVYHFYENENKD